MLEDKKPQLFAGTHPLSDNFRREMESMMSRFLGAQRHSCRWKQPRNARASRRWT